VSLTIGFVTDLHFGPATYHDGKLRKLTRHAADLAALRRARDPPVAA